jgi:hypothetical protein
MEEKMSKVRSDVIVGGIRLILALTFFTAAGVGLVTGSFGWAILTAVASFLFYMFGLAFLIAIAEGPNSTK